MQTTLSSVTGSAAVAAVVEGLEEDIIFGRLLPRERLVEDDLIQRYATKRHVVRQALAELERRGVVVKERNRTAIVRYYSRSEVDQIYEARIVVQRAAAERFRLPPDPALVEDLERLQAEHAAAVTRGALSDIHRLNTRFHHQLYGACANPFLVDMVSHYNWLTHGIRSHGIGRRDLLRNAIAEHARMVECVRQGDRDTLVRLCIDHTLPARDFYVDKYCRSGLVEPALEPA